MDTKQTSQPTTNVATPETSSPLNLLGEQSAGGCCGGSACGTSN